MDLSIERSPLKQRHYLAVSAYRISHNELAQRVSEVFAGWNNPLEAQTLRNDFLEFPEQEYNPQARKFLIWEPTAHQSSSILFGNIIEGSASLCHMLESRHALAGLRFRVSLVPVEYPICELIVSMPSGHRRIIRAMKDIKWDFFTDGPLLDFEKPERYRVRRIKDRFDVGLLFDYCRRLGWDFESPELWTPIGTAINLKQIG